MEGGSSMQCQSHLLHVQHSKQLQPVQSLIAWPERWVEIIPPQPNTLACVFRTLTTHPCDGSTYCHSTTHAEADHCCRCTRKSSSASKRFRSPLYVFAKRNVSSYTNVVSKVFISTPVFERPSRQDSFDWKRTMQVEKCWNTFWKQQEKRGGTKMPSSWQGYQS